MPIIGSDFYGSDSISNLYGYIRYNGWTFEPPRFRSEITMRPEMSADGRTVLCNIYTLTVRALVTDDSYGAYAFITSEGDNTNHLFNRRTDQFNARANIQSIRSKLSQNGRDLRIHGLGFDINLNTGEAGSMFDVRWGPKTKSLKMNQIGNGVIWQIDWVLEFALPECPSAGSGHSGHTQGSAHASDISYISFPYAEQGELEGLTYNVAYTSDMAGLTQRVISGEITVAINRASVTGDGAVNQIIATADGLRERITPVLPENFRRLSQNWTLSNDKRTLVFTIVDVELPGENAYPVGIVDMALDHTVSVEGNILPVAPMLSCSFSGYFEAGKGHSLGDCLNRVILIMQARLDASRTFMLNADNLQQGNPVFITGVSITESLYGARRVSFAIHYLVMNMTGNALFGGLIQRAALFRKVTNVEANWTAWAAGFGADGNGAWTQRGIAKLAFNASSDRIVGPCDASDYSGLADADYPSALSGGSGSFVGECPPKKRSYMSWQPEVDLDTDDGTMIHTPMAPEPADTDPRPYVGSHELPDPGDLGHNPENYEWQGHLVRKKASTSDASVRPSASYTTGSSVVTMTISLDAVRMGSPPELPKAAYDFIADLIEEGKLVPVGKPKVKSKRMGRLGICPLFALRATYKYTLLMTDPDEINNTVKSVKNLLLSTSSDPEGNKLGSSGDNN